MAYDRLAKVILIGPSGAGKSNLLLAMTGDRFIEEHELTIGVEFGSRVVKVEDKAIKLQIWDTAGRGSFRSITKSYYRGVQVACLVWDSSLSKSVDYLKDWMEELTHQSPEAKLIFVRCKSDLDNTPKGASQDEIADQIKQIQGFAGSDAIIFSTSAKDQKGIKELTHKIAEVGLPLALKIEATDIAEGRRQPRHIAARAPKPAEPFFLIERLEKIKHTREPRAAELKIYFEKAKPTTKDIIWLLMHLDSVEKDCSTANNIRNYLNRFRIDIDHKQRPTEGPVVELLKLLDEEERAKPPKVVTLLTFASYSDLYVAERDVERKFILDVAKNMYLGKAPYEDLDPNNAPKSVRDILAKPANRIIPERP